MRDRERQAHRHERACKALLACRVGVGVEQADGYRVGAARSGSAAHALQFGGGERKRHLSFEVSSLDDAQAHRARHERFRALRSERIKVAPVLAANLDQILETGIGQQQDARALALEQRVGRHGRAVSDQIGKQTAARPTPRAFKHHFKSGNHRAGRIVGRRKHLVDQQATTGDRDQVGEGAAGVDSDDDSRGHQGLSKILKFGERAAAAKAPGASSSPKVPEINGRGSTLPETRAASAGANRPHREPTIVISLITACARLSAAPAAAVLLRITMPRGRTSVRARFRPALLPVQSITTSKPGSSRSSSCASTPSAARRSSFSRWRPASTGA